MTKEEYNKVRQDIIDKKANRQRQIDEGYTYYDELMEWHNNPENRSDLGLKLDKMVNKAKGGLGSLLNNLGESLASKLIGQDPFTNYIPQPKAHDEINSLLNQSIEGVDKDLILGLITGGAGGGTGKGLSKLLLAMKGKIKDGKMIPQQPFRQGMVGKPKYRDVETPGLYTDLKALPRGVKGAAGGALGYGVINALRELFGGKISIPKGATRAGWDEDELERIFNIEE